MATRCHWTNEEAVDSRLRSRLRAIVETPFYANHVHRIESLEEAYQLAKNCPGTIVTDQNVYQPEVLGLGKDAKVLLFNDGRITGRSASARRIIGDPGVDNDFYYGVAREATFHGRDHRMYHAQAYVGLDKAFMVKAHLLIPEGFENTLYSWMLNFQHQTTYWEEIYDKSTLYQEGDIFVYSDPYYQVEGHPNGLSLFDPASNCVMLLGMRYFGEHKKATLTLGWTLGTRHGFLPCHGGMKQAVFEDGRKTTLGVFGLSGSGKSTLTHDKSIKDAKVSILHDDAYVIHVKEGYTVALEPSYFDKTQDYPTGDPANQYLVTVQNCGITLNEKGEKVLVTTDIRNGNGRAVKSHLWTDNRVQTFKESVDAIIWLMKDEAFPPVMKITDPILASTLGATLATKRTTAENIAKGVDPNALVIEPYANPFRTYPLGLDYEQFKTLFQDTGVTCYILNTGSFRGKDIPKEVTIGIINQILRDETDFKPMGQFSHLEMMEQEGFEVVFDEDYQTMWEKALAFRMEFVQSKKTALQGKDALPEESYEALKELLNEVKSH